jgi:hypothetical protein
MWCVPTSLVNISDNIDWNIGLYAFMESAAVYLR